MTANDEAEIICQADYGFTIAAPPHDRSGKIIAESGAFERGTSRLIHSLLQCGDHFVDLGANIGYFTLLAAARVGSCGTVSSFEPSPFIRAQLERNIRLNQFEQVSVSSCAVSDRCGTIDFFEGPSEHTGISSLRPVTRAVTSYPVEAITLDRALPDNSVRVVKIDVEGAESAAINGMKETLQRARPAIVLESTDTFLREMGSSANELFQTLFALGYQAWFFGDDWLRPILEFYDAPTHQCNVLFTHEDRHDLHILNDAGYRIERGALIDATEFGRTLRVLCFAMHGDAAIELCQLCRSAGVRIDIAGIENGLVRATTTERERRRLTLTGAEAPGGEVIRQRLQGRIYDAVIVGAESQIRQFETRIRSLDPMVPMIVRHSNNIFATLLELSVAHFMSPSPAALEKMNDCHTLLTRKLVCWDELPPVNLNPAKRDGFGAYVHDYQRSWPDAWERLQDVNRRIHPALIMAYGIANPAGPIPDLAQMNRSRATVQIKDSGICCFSVVRSMAMGTPVVCDRVTYERTFLDGVDGPIVCEDPATVASTLQRLGNDDTYWLQCSKQTLTAARRQFLCDDDLASRFLRFLHVAQNCKRSTT